MPVTTELAILHADACGYTAAMARSEDVAISRLLAGQRLIRKTVQAHGGRVVDTAGDSALLTFETPRAAFHAACHLQSTIRELSSAKAEDAPFQYRFGLTRGRVHVDGNQVFGHAVNLAARIESLVAPGSIGVETSIWNETRPLADGARAVSRLLFAKPEEPAIQFFEVSDGSPGFSRNISPEASRNAPVILLIPFADGTEQLDRDLALEAVVWECMALFGAQGWQTEIAKGTPQGFERMLATADYVIRLRASKLVASLRLAAIISSRHMRRGLQTFTREANGGGEAAQAALALAALLGTAMAHAETERIHQSQGVGSFQLVAAGRELLASFAPDKVARAIAYLRKALSIDPEFPFLLSSLGRAHAVAWRFGWVDHDIDHLETARTYAEKAANLAPNDARCQADLGFVRFWNNEARESAWHYERSMAALPFHPELAADAGMVFSYVGRAKEAAAILERSVANLPMDSDYRLWSLGDVYYSQQDYRSSLKWLGRMADQSQAQRLLAASKARLGLDASAHVEAVLKQQPDFSVRHWIAIQPFANEADRIDYEEALLLAGLPA